MSDRRHRPVLIRQGATSLAGITETAQDLNTAADDRFKKRKHVRSLSTLHALRAPVPCVQTILRSTVTLAAALKARNAALASTSSCVGLSLRCTVDHQDCAVRIFKPQKFQRNLTRGTVSAQTSVRHRNTAARCVGVPSGSLPCGWPGVCPCRTYNRKFSGVQHLHRVCNMLFVYGVGSQSLDQQEH